jgi:hypothetical protein
MGATALQIVCRIAIKGVCGSQKKNEELDSYKPDMSGTMAGG